jgi:rhamnose utilization protein RhaD (predicted bifunctional aldolase and dehydrogenase)
LLCHVCRKKLLVLLPVHMSNPEVTAAQCRNIMKRFCRENLFRVIVLKGSGENQKLMEDAAMVAAALAELNAAVEPGMDAVV